MNDQKYIFAAALVLLSLNTSALVAQSKEPPPSQMIFFLESIKKLQPFMISDEAFKDPTNEKKIQAELDKLKEVSKSLSHEKRIAKPGVKDAALKVQSHFSELADAFPLSKAYSRYLLHATLDGCGSCHSQVRGSEKPLFNFDAKDLAGTPFQKGEFLFAVRQYPQAIKQYEEVLNKADIIDQRRAALERGLVVYLRHFKDFDSAETWIRSFSKKRPDHASYSQPYLDDLKALKKSKFPYVQKSNSKEVENFAKNSCQTQNGFVNRVFASGLLHDYLENRRQKNEAVKPVIYYWVGKCDASLQSSYIFSLTNLMFEHCIDLAGKSSQGEKCFEEVESQIVLGFTGSSGVHLPEDQISKLNALRKKVGLKAKHYPVNKEE